jgi:hypothetical protein
MLQVEAAPRFVTVRAHNLKTIFVGILLNRRHLIFSGVLLAFRGHPNILCCAH